MADDTPDPEVYRAFVEALPQACADLYVAWSTDRSGPAFWARLGEVADLDPLPDDSTGLATLLGNLVTWVGDWVRDCTADAKIAVVPMVPSEGPPLIGQVAALIANALDGDPAGIQASIHALAADDLLPALLTVMDLLVAVGPAIQQIRLASGLGPVHPNPSHN